MPFLPPAGGRPAAPVCRHQYLPLLAALTESLAPPDAGPHHWLLRVGSVDGGVELSASPLPPSTGHPGDVLLGLDAPSAWLAVGLASTGTAHRLDGPARLDSVAVLVTVLVDRSGDAASGWRALEGDGPSTVTVTTDGTGPLIDLCRRVLGLATGPPRQPPLVWWTQQWLDAVLRAAVHEPDRCWTWPAAVALHPLVDLVAGPVGAPPPGPDRFARAIADLSARTGWERLRQVAAEGPAPEVAAWFDAGSFSRWTLGQHLGPGELLVELEALLSAPTVAAVAAVLDRWDLASSDGDGGGPTGDGDGPTGADGWWPAP